MSSAFAVELDVSPARGRAAARAFAPTSKVFLRALYLL
jgi:hypothetical protein